MTPTRRILLLGATGTIGRATLAALLAQGYSVTCFLRQRPGGDLGGGLPGGAELRFGDVTNPASLAADGFCGQRFDAVISCLASRTGRPADAWAIDHAANSAVLAAAKASGTPQMLLLSAICVQKPLLAFQQAKLAFEAELAASGLTYSIIRPTAFFKSLSGQIARVQRGKPFLVFGEGTLTACKPISDADLADYIVGCLDDPARHNRILPIGGPGPAITPLDQARMLEAALGRPVRVKQVPVALLDAIIAGLGLLGRISARARAKADLARIGRYYATESMLVLNPVTGRYDADATPETGRDTLAEFTAAVLRGVAQVERGDHAVF